MSEVTTISMAPSGCRTCEEGRLKLAKAIVVIEAMRKRVSELESALEKAQGRDPLAIAAATSLASSTSQPVAAAITAATVPASLTTQPVAAAQTDSDSRRERNNGSMSEVMAVQEVVITLEAQLAERDAQVQQLELHLEATERRLQVANMMLRGTHPEPSPAFYASQALGEAWDPGGCRQGRR
eukprot:TRINITY_DN51121_c0_g1_i1.p1 TRINITY_DN51121_c0_g1~~TRINITY_DN51121_c0_g1_i1.p1  ORF type:complete len:183 (-),score=38.92 TRINITY_DN51121_c0_g1_i1:166-714(-)